MKLADKPSVMLRRAALWLAPLLLLITVFFIPVTNTKMKLFQLGLLLVTLTSLLVTLWKWKWAFRIAIVFLLFALILFFSPGRGQHQRPKLPQAYADALLRYDGSTYWWGGENSLGIDCSGLIRRAMIDATFKEGLLSLDGGLLRAAADLWFHDCSAEALGQGYRGYADPVTETNSINALDHTKVRQGDLAIAGGGAHILAYLGNQVWIQADPNPEKVVKSAAPSQNGWYKGPVKIVRWKWLEAPPAAAGGTTP